MDGLRIEIISRDLSRMLEELGSIDASVEFSSVADSVAARAAQGALGRTRAAKETSIRKRYDNATWTSLDGKKYKLTWNLHNNNLWARIQQNRASNLFIRLQARGLAKQSWLHLGNKVRASSRAPIPPMRSPAYVAQANHRMSQYPIDVQTYSAGDGNTYARTIVNNSPLAEGAGMESALYLSMQGETRYFERLMAHRFYLSHASRAAKYPGIFTTPGSLAASAPSGLS